MIVALVADLMFESRIDAVARQVEADVRTVRGVEQVRAALDDTSGVLLDMSVAPEDTLALIGELKAARGGLPIIAFLSHVQVELTGQTREAGADEVLSRSAFVARLPQILSELSR